MADQSRAEFALAALVAAGHVTQELVDRAMELPGAPQPQAALAGGRFLGYVRDDGRNDRRGSMTQDQLPEHLLLAVAANRLTGLHAPISKFDCTRIAEEIANLRAGYAAARLEIESLHAQLEAIGAGGVEPLRKTAQAAQTTLTEQQAHDMGAKGAPATDAERLLFEAWMRGHCWALSCSWRGTSYRSDAEESGDVDPRAMQTRRIWAAWRDRAALAAQDAPAVPAAITSETGNTISAQGAAITSESSMAAPAPGVPSEPSPTAGMNIAQRILHVGGRNNAAGYVEFGSIQAVEALVRQVLRDMPVAPQQAAPIDWSQAGALIEAAHSSEVRQFTTGTTNWAAAIYRHMARHAQQAAPAEGDALDAERAAWLKADDMAALERLDETLQDGEGYDVPAAQMKRMAEIGVVRHHSAGRYSITSFGRWVLGSRLLRKPLETIDECNARLGEEHRAALAEQKGGA